jgi:hypothetical protein
MPDLLAGQRPTAGADEPPFADLVEELLAGTGRAVWVEGGPGTGKTRLLAAVLAEARSCGIQVAGSSAAHRPGPRLRLNPIMECLGLDPTSRDLRRVLNAVSPQAVPEQRPATQATGGMAGERLMAMFRSLSAAGPLVVAIDDLHLADPASLRIWARLVTLTEQAPLLLLASARPDRPAAERADLAHLRSTHATRLLLS